MSDADEPRDGQDEPVTDESVLVGATAEQPAAETLVEAGGVTAPVAPVNPGNQRDQDVRYLLTRITELGAEGVSRTNLRAYVDLPDERFGAAIAWINQFGAVQDDLHTGALRVSAVGESMLRPPQPSVDLGRLFEMQTAAKRDQAARDQEFAVWLDRLRRQQPPDDVLMLAVLDKLAPAQVSQVTLRCLVGLSEERFPAQFSQLLSFGYLGYDGGGGLVVTASGRWRLASYAEEVAPKPSAPAVDLATAGARYLAAGAQELPVWQEQRRQWRLDREQQARDAWSVVAPKFSMLKTYSAEWAQIAEPDLSATNSMALKPRFPLPGNVDLYVRVVQQQGADGLWLCASTGGPYVWLPAHSGPNEIERKLGLVLKFGMDAVGVQTVQPTLNGAA